MASKSCPSDWTPLLLLALGSQVVGQGLLVYALGTIPPLVVGLALLTQPAISALIGWLAYDERLTALDWVGAFAIALALVLVRLPGGVARARAQAQNGRRCLTAPSKPCASASRLAVGTHAVFDGWTRQAVDSAAAELGIDRDQARLAMPKDAPGMIDAYIQAVDAAMAAAFPPEAHRQDEDPRENPRIGLVPASKP